MEQTEGEKEKMIGEGQNNAEKFVEYLSDIIEVKGLDLNIDSVNHDSIYGSEVKIGQDYDDLTTTINFYNDGTIEVSYGDMGGVESTEEFESYDDFIADYADTLGESLDVQPVSEDDKFGAGVLHTFDLDKHKPNKVEEGAFIDKVKSLKDRVKELYRNNEHCQERIEDWLDIHYADDDDFWEADIDNLDDDDLMELIDDIGYYDEDDFYDLEEALVESDWRTTPYGFSEKEYKGYIITNNGEGYASLPGGYDYSVNYCGDEVLFETEEEAMAFIDEISGDPNESLRRKKEKMLGESLNEGVVDDFITKTKSILDKNGIKYEDVYPDELGLEAGYGVTVNFGISGDYEAKKAIKVLERELNSGDCYELVSGPARDSDTELNIYADAFGYMNESLTESVGDLRSIVKDFQAKLKENGFRIFDVREDSELEMYDDHSDMQHFIKVVFSRPDRAQGDLEAALFGYDDGILYRVTKDWEIASKKQYSSYEEFVKDLFGTVDESVSLGGGMKLPYDDNYCIFVKSADKKVTILKINNKKEFQDAERRYGSFINVCSTASAAKSYTKSFTGPAKEWPVEVLTEGALTEGAMTNGSYSLYNGWVKVPDKDSIPDEYPDLEPEYSEWVERAESCETMEDIDNFIDDVYKLRQQGLLNSGEYGRENLIFKELRNNGYLQRLKDMKVQKQNKEMSLESLKESLLTQKQLDSMRDELQNKYPYFNWKAFEEDGKLLIGVDSENLDSDDLDDIDYEISDWLEQNSNKYGFDFNDSRDYWDNHLKSKNGWVGFGIKCDIHKLDESLNEDVPHSNIDTDTVAREIFIDLDLETEVTVKDNNIIKIELYGEDVNSHNIDRLGDWCEDHLERALNYEYYIVEIYEGYDAVVYVKIEPDIRESYKKSFKEDLSKFKVTGSYRDTSKKGLNYKKFTKTVSAKDKKSVESILKRQYDTDTIKIDSIKEV